MAAGASVSLEGAGGEVAAGEAVRSFSAFSAAAFSCCSHHHKTALSLRRRNKFMCPVICMVMVLAQAMLATTTSVSWTKNRHNDQSTFLLVGHVSRGMYRYQVHHHQVPSDRLKTFYIRGTDLYTVCPDQILSKMSGAPHLKLEAAGLSGFALLISSLALPLLALLCLRRCRPVLLPDLSTHHRHVGSSHLMPLSRKEDTCLN